MNKRDARKLSSSAQRELRGRAVVMKNQGMPYQKISQCLGVSVSAVQIWVSRYRQAGEEGLALGRRGRIAGSHRRLTARQEQALQRAIIDKTPDQLKLPFALWTRGAIAQYIQKRYGLSLPIRTLGEYLKRWGFTPQRPRRKAYEQVPEEVAQWMKKTYPRIARRARREGGEILWGDETGLSNQDHAGRGYAPKGETPVVRGLAQRATTSMISAVSNRGSLRFMIYKGGLNTALFLKFLKRLVAKNPRKVFLIVDRLRVHKARLVLDWLATKTERIELFYLPAYSPELNPDEYLNNTLKAQMRPLPRLASVSQLQAQLGSLMKSNQKNPALISSLFQHPEVRYAA